MSAPLSPTLAAQAAAVRAITRPTPYSPSEARAELARRHRELLLAGRPWGASILVELRAALDSSDVVAVNRALARAAHAACWR